MRAAERSKAGVLATVLALVVAGLGVGATPVGAMPDYKATAVVASKQSDKVTLLVGGLRRDIRLMPTAQVLMGRFTEAGGAQAFLYNPGQAPDGLLRYWLSNGKISYSFTRMDVDGWYRPLASDLDKDGRADIVWYSPGGGQDRIWWFETDGSHTTESFTLGGDFRPIAVSGVYFTEGMTYPKGIIWYQPGPGHDEMWRFPNGRTHTVQNLTINGRFQPIGGTFSDFDIHPGVNSVLWYSPDGPDYLWTFNAILSDPVVERLPDVGPGARPVGGRFARYTEGTGFERVLWLRPGSPRETIWSFQPKWGTGQPARTEVTSALAGSLMGDWRPFRYGADDVLLLGPSTNGAFAHINTSGIAGTVNLTNLPPAPVAGTGYVDFAS